MTLADIKLEVIDTHRQSKCNSCIYNITEKQCDIPILNFWGVNVDNTTVQEVLEWIDLKIKQNQHRLIFFVNPACLNVAAQNIEYFTALDRADRILPDGIGLKIGCWLLNENLKTNLNGTDLFPKICEQAATNGTSIFLLGGEPTVATRAAIAMQQQYPDLIIAGTHHGFFTPDEEDIIIEMINASNASILFVGLGVPKQELWLSKVRPLLSTNICLGVGGLFDYYSGRIPRAPIWMRKIGLEWVWRIYQEPSRLWKRYIIGNPIFIQRILQQRIDLSKSQTYNTNICRPRLEKIKSKITKAFYKISTSNFIKRSMDVTISLTLLIILLPLFLLVSLMIYIDSPGPILYKQTRVGKLGELFIMWKFRSMDVNADNQLKDLECDNETQCGILFKIKNDPRITKIGRIIRKTSIDELPQLWNVLKGEMSLVGPRPALLTEVQLYSVNDKRRLEVKPGITCIWQVSGRSNIPFNEQVMMDIQYIDSHSIWLDIKLLLLTIPAVLTGHGAY